MVKVMEDVIMCHQQWYREVHSLKCNLCVFTWKLKLKTAYCQQTLMLDIDIELYSKFHLVNLLQGQWMHIQALPIYALSIFTNWCTHLCNPCINRFCKNFSPVNILTFLFSPKYIYIERERDKMTRTSFEAKGSSGRTCDFTILMH